MSQIVQFKVFLLFLNCVFIQCNDDCSSGWFGSNCQYLCHCERAEYCDYCEDCEDCNFCESNGQCPTKCAKGWFGQHCQYQDLSVLPGTTVTNLPTPWLTDGDDTTCNTDPNLQSVTISWSTSNLFTWLRVAVNSQSKGSNIDFNFKDSNGENVACNNLLISILDETTIDYRCDINKTIKELTVTGSGLDVLCSLYISGGRNLALKQEAVHSSNHNYYDLAPVAVDGNTDNQYHHESCYHSKHEDSYPYWNLTLDNAKSLHRFVIYNRADCCGERLLKFKLELLDASDKIVWTYPFTNEKVKLVYIMTRPDKEPVKKIVISPTAPNITGIVLTLCEVEVFGECAPGTWGLDCNLLCPRECSTWCHQDTGLCLTCLGYSDPPLCKADCGTGKYGPNCSQSCSYECLGQRCDPVNGHCLNCADGRYTPFCQVCPPGNYGTNCSKECSDQCMDRHMCDPFNGHCFQGCKDGYTGSNCIDVCPVGRYGFLCSEGCSDQCFESHKCDPVHGTCYNGCKDGYTGSNCIDVCPLGRYGSQCSQECSGQCFESRKCDPVNGTCYNRCKDGYTGSNCFDFCPKRSYGSQCLQKCSDQCFESGKCDPVNGTCYNGCKDGYTGSKCIQRNQLTNPHFSSSSMVSIIVGICSSTVLVIVIVWYVRRRKLRRQRQFESKIKYQKDGLISDSSTCIPENFKNST